MLLSKFVFQKRKSIFYSILVSVALFVISLSLILMLLDSIKQRELLDTTDRFIAFESKVERLIYANVSLLQGYEAYIKSNPNLNEDSAYIYLENLLAGSEGYIRNIGVIKDTTIIWNYPKSLNSSAIGVDLAKVDSQKDLVLKAKSELITVMQGPVELVQGGTGFIVRIPITNSDKSYWGQVSLVLESDKIIEDINSLSESAGLNIAVFSHDNESVPFSGDISTVGKFPLVFNIDQSFINWKIYVSPQSGWQINIFIFTLSIIFAIILSAFVGLVSYKAKKAQYQLLNLSTHDALSGLYNRHFLEGYQSNIIEAAKRDEKKIGLMSLDLNHFKSINDTYGHSVGDMVLVETARVLVETVKIKGSVFRLGGDEFLVILPEIQSRGDIQLVKEQLLKSFLEDFDIPGYPIKVTPSIGNAMFPEDGEDIDALLQAADKKMYKEKNYSRRNDD